MVVEILRLGIYQIIYMDKVPESAAVNESVKLAKKLTRGLSGFVNAILRSVIREQDTIGIEDLAANDIEAISFIYNIPLWLINLWIREFGRDKTEDLCGFPAGSRSARSVSVGSPFPPHRRKPASACCLQCFLPRRTVRRTSFRSSPAKFYPWWETDSNSFLLQHLLRPQSD